MNPVYITWATHWIFIRNYEQFSGLEKRMIQWKERWQAMKRKRDIRLRLELAMVTLQATPLS